MDMLFHDSDSESYTESSDSEDLECIGSSFSGRAQSILLNLGQSIEKIDELLQFEREFAHGDIVCSISDPSGQMGRVVDVDMNADLETTYGDIINDVNTKNLLRIRTFVSGDYVVLGQWLGKIDKVVDVVTVVFDDGEKCEMMTDKCDVIPISSNFVDDRQWSYYPGQRVQVKGLNIFKPTKWFCGTWNVSRVEGTICTVKVGSVHVNWIASVIPVSQTRLFVPPTLQDPKCLTLLSCFPHANWQIGDSCMLPNDYFLNHQIMKFPFDVSSQFLEEETISKSGPYVIEKMKTKVDVLWQDGSYSKGLDPRTLIPVNSIGDHDFFPDQFVLQTLSDDPHVLIMQCCGVVENVDAQERTVKVKWGTHESNSMVDSSGAQTEIVSAYELIEHPQYSYCIGEVVFRLNVSWQDHKGEISPITKMEFNSVPPLEMDPHEEKHLNEDHFGSSIGNVIGFKDGCIVVRWANGLISEIGPHEISGIDKDEEFALHNVEPVQENVNTETTDPDKQLSLKKDEDLLKTVANDTAKDCRNDLWSASSLLVPREAFNFLTNIVTSLFGSHGPCSSSGKSSAFDGLRRNRDIIAPKIANQIEYSKIEASVVDDEKEWNSDPHFGESQDKKIPISLADEKPPRFPQFDVAFDYSDHHFVKGVGKGSLSTQVINGFVFL
ncbi:putative ubiquitin-conjugating enzyme E2 24 [Acorus gramineus]|uniref:Ubiquitin-conjugating enzyme E2 24 n=1 Tax=Acorus gramineus TaxID=55184 RepID=A0AAV9BFI7_ACOGR|nr:putative ubiquitin-conjugating enzyme E2 24 [Acorus gramineus]